VSAAADFERAIDRAVIWKEAAEIAERQLERAMDNAAYLAAPRVRLVDEQRRIVRVVNAPVEARRHPPRTLTQWWTDTMYRRGFEPVGRFHGRPTPRDLDYVVPRTEPGRDFLAILRDQIEPSVVMENGRGELLVSFDSPADYVAEVERVMGGNVA
jgi:hypothetical protein